MDRGAWWAILHGVTMSQTLIFIKLFKVNLCALNYFLIRR